jgi:hypothetical protein
MSFYYYFMILYLNSYLVCNLVLLLCINCIIIYFQVITFLILNDTETASLVAFIREWDKFTNICICTFLLFHHISYITLIFHLFLFSPSLFTSFHLFSLFSPLFTLFILFLSSLYPLLWIISWWWLCILYHVLLYINYRLN